MWPLMGDPSTSQTTSDRAFSIEISPISTGMEGDGARSVRTARREATRYAGLAGVSVLVIDDDGHQSRALAELLLDVVGAVTTASDGVEALGCLRDVAPDIVLLDVVIPGLRGPALVHLLREWRPELPIVLVTGLPGFAADVESLRAMPAVGFVTKPIDVEELLEAMGDLLPP
ncbi:MAG: response regulator [Kofleriaceae bacterium]|nr:MAG: response regulator [Kofleriaceae bacterium]